MDPVTGAEITEARRARRAADQGPGVFPGYLPASGVPDPFDEDGYLKTGDILEIAGDELQYLRYVDRSKDMVVRGGMKISAAELEGLIAGHPKVADVAVVAYPDDVLGERACAIVVPRPGETVNLAEIVGVPARDRHRDVQAARAAGTARTNCRATRWARSSSGNCAPNWLVPSPQGSAGTAGARPASGCGRRSRSA